MLKRILPLIVFVALAALLLSGIWMRKQDETLGRNPSDIPSPLIGKKAPIFSLPALHHPENMISNADFVGTPYVLNVWGSWCPECRTEHPAITDLAKTGKIRVVGFNYKDEPADALRWLGQFGDPYTVIVADVEGRSAIDWGIYGAPETFVVDAAGVVVFKHIGALTPQLIEREILARLDALNGASP